MVSMKAVMKRLNAYNLNELPRSRDCGVSIPLILATRSVFYKEAQQSCGELNPKRLNIFFDFLYDDTPIPYKIKTKDNNPCQSTS